ncbi:hypothetical protein [Nostoc parmelioides]|uniref:Uncharacterized protein n=1 Tax=Nostoc parmelioides FACHB-3921 TaxID=2692909 RepID=A0ABR8BHE1_9NOSO|nr:hypothetical protein [Nostoc parmelioides]MBD2253293.1 hypothetical protein [Nostoc parmelioides FACHB-3921]
MTDLIDPSQIIVRPRPTLLSTFELLVKPIAPVGSGPGVVARTVIQGYFLTIANTSNSDIKVRLQFTATTPELDLTNTVTITDVQGVNDFSDLTPIVGDPKRFIFNLGIGANDTALFTLLPDVSKPEVIKANSLEVRGYVEIALTSPSSSVRLLLTPEHRGTFVPQNFDTVRAADFDQLVYALPTSTGQSEFTLTGPAKPNKELKLEIKEIEKLVENKLAEILPVTPQTQIPNDLQRVIGLMAQRLDELEQRTASNGSGRAFIQVEERPSVGQHVVNQ